MSYSADQPSSLSFYLGQCVTGMSHDDGRADDAMTARMIMVMMMMMATLIGIVVDMTPKQVAFSRTRNTASSCPDPQVLNAKSGRPHI